MNHKKSIQMGGEIVKTILIDDFTNCYVEIEHPRSMGSKRHPITTY